MPVYGKPKSSMMAPVQPSVQAAAYPGSVGGVNALDPVMNMPQIDCLYTFNLMPVELGMRLRKGYREWAVNVGPNNDDEVRTIIGFEGQTTDAADDRLWAITQNGIYDVTLFNETDPNEDVSFLQQGEAAGFGVYTQFSSLSNDHYLFYADGLNGIHQYAAETQLWSVPTGWTYDDPQNPGTPIDFPVANVAFVMLHKLRIWVILEDDTQAYYLPPFSISGELQVFSFGSQMKVGGNLQGLWSWTLDGGNGIDDILIAVSRGGDVMVYAGSDPIDSTWRLQGTWFVGETPISRRLVAQHGAEMYLLSVFGVTSLRDMLAGSSANVATQSASAKVSRYLREDVQRGLFSYQWSLQVNPSDAFMQIITPKPASTPYVQYNQNLSTVAWGFWQNVPINCAQHWSGEYYIGNLDGKVYIYDGVLDASELPQPNEWTNVITNVPGPEWTDNLDDSYTIDGTQVDNSEVEFQSSSTVADNTQYTLSYTISDYTAGAHWITYGNMVSSPQTGNGTFGVTITSAFDGGDKIGIWGNANTACTFSLISASLAADIGQPIGFTMLTAFQTLNGNHATFKIPGFIRTIGVLAGTIALNVEAIFDYSIEDVVSPPADQPTEGVSLWDSALWDVATWDFAARGESYPYGAQGLGRTVAIGMAGSASSRITIVGWDMLYTEGGYM